MFNFFTNNFYFLNFTAVVPLVFFIIYSYIKKKNFYFFLACNLSLIALAFSKNIFINIKILSIVFLIISLFFISHSQKLKSIKYLFFSFLIISTLIINLNSNINVLLLIILLTILFSNENDFNFLFINTSLAIVVYLTSLNNIDQLLKPSLTVYLILLFTIIIQIKYIFTQKNFEQLFLLPIIVLASFVNQVLCISLLSIFYLSIFLKSKKISSFFLFSFFFIGNNIILYTFSNFINFFESNYIYYLLNACTILSLSIFLENSIIFKINFKNILFSILGLIVLFVPIYFINKKVLSEFNIIYLSSFFIAILNSLFIKFFRLINLPRFSNYFTKITFTIKKYILIIFINISLLSFKLIINIKKARSKLLMKIGFLIKGFFLQFKKYLKKLKFNLTHKISFLITYIDEFVSKKTSFEAIIFLFSFVILFIYILSEVVWKS